MSLYVIKGFPDGVPNEGIMILTAVQTAAPYDEVSFTINLQANVIGSGGVEPEEGAPIIKCKWEYDKDVLLPPAEPGSEEYCCHHDAYPYEPGLQVKPVIGGDVTVGYYAIVTDPQGVGHIDHVYADVWHPNGEFKYQIELFPQGIEGDTYDKSIAIDEWNHVIDWHPYLITYGEWERQEGWTKDEDILWELEEEEAYLYYGEAKISYFQPVGEYTVGVRAIDDLDMWCDFLFNQFEYLDTNQPPIASFTYSLPNPLNTDIIEFTDTSTDPDGTVVSWWWNFSDGYYSDLKNPIHCFYVNGTFNVSLTVTDNNGAIDTEFALIVVRSSSEAIEDLIIDIEEMGLETGLENSLKDKLMNALESIGYGLIEDAINQLNAFINQVEAQRGKKLTDEQADYLVSTVQMIIDSLLI